MYVVHSQRDNPGEPSSRGVKRPLDECGEQEGPEEERTAEGQRRRQDEVYGAAEQTLWKEDNGEVPQHQGHCAQHLQSVVDHGDGPDDHRKLVAEQRGRRHRDWQESRLGYWTRSCNPVAHSSPYDTTSGGRRTEQSADTGSLDLGGGPQTANMLQQYQQQPDYTPYGGIGGYGGQQNSGYYNYSSPDASWFSPSSASDHSQMVSEPVVSF